MIAITKLPDGNVRVHVECVLKAGANRHYFQLLSEESNPSRDDYPPIVRLIGKALKWKELLTSGTYRKLDDLASALGLCEAYLRDVLRLAYLSPTIIEKVVRGELPEASVTKYAKIDTPLWAEQEERIGAL